MKKRDCVLLLALLVLVVVVSAGTYTYARYLTTVETSSDVEIAKWQIAVKDGANELSKTQKLALTVAENANVASGKMAPGSTASGEFTIDPTGSEVAIDYSVSIDTKNITNDKITIKSLSVGDNVLTKDSEGNYVGTISLNDVLANKLTTVKLTVEWTNDENNNELDTTTGKTAGTINLPIVITVKQHID